MPYTPSTAPQELRETKDVLWTRLLEYIEKELLQISISQQEQITVELRESGAEPSKPRDGMLVYADGVGWNPGGGRGLYVRDSGAWVKVS